MASVIGPLMEELLFTASLVYGGASKNVIFPQWSGLPPPPLVVRTSLKRTFSPYSHYGNSYYCTGRMSLIYINKCSYLAQHLFLFAEVLKSMSPLPSFTIAKFLKIKNKYLNFTGKTVQFCRTKLAIFLHFFCCCLPKQPLQQLDIGLMKKFLPLVIGCVLRTAGCSIILVFNRQI